MKLEEKALSQPAKLRSKRSPTIDTMKFFLILAIYVGHYGTNSGMLFPFFSGYHVCVFFMLSGLWATKKQQQTVLGQVANGLVKYMIPWGIWVVINTAYNAILYSYDMFRTLDTFILYFKSVRGFAEVGGSWFIPCFFLVSVIYHILLKLTALCKVKNQIAATAIIALISGVTHYCFRYLYPLPQNLIFSVHCIPEYLFYYALGAFLYSIYTKIKAPFRRGLSVPLVVIPVLYMALVYFGYQNKMWYFIYRIPVRPLHLLPEAGHVVMALLFTRVLGKLFAFPFCANLGKATLVLCLSESAMKTSVWLIANVFGLVTNVTNPIQSLCFSVIVMAVAMKTAVPVTNTLTEKAEAFLSGVLARFQK